MSLITKTVEQAPHLILLPGLDGTGELYKPLLTELEAIQQADTFSRFSSITVLPLAIDPKANALKTEQILKR